MTVVWRIYDQYDFLFIISTEFKKKSCKRILLGKRIWKYFPPVGKILHFILGNVWAFYWKKINTENRRYHMEGLLFRRSWSADKNRDICEELQTIQNYFVLEKRLMMNFWLFLSLDSLSRNIQAVCSERKLKEKLTDIW